MDLVYTLASYAAPFYSLQYPTAPPPKPDSFHDSQYFNAGRLDICIVISCIAVMAVLRDVFRLMIFEPFARWKLTRDLQRTPRHSQKTSNGYAVNGSANGHVANGNGHANGFANGSATSSPSKPTTKELRRLNRSVVRFAEQGWSVFYYSLQWSYGLYVHFRLPTRMLDPIDLWLGYPHIPIPAPVKFYYLTQTAFYLHQVLIINAEARRKDHVQMMAHHIITVILMVASYMTNFTRVGCVIMVLMDWCDIFLPLAKMIRYLAISQYICDLAFGWFMLSWFVTRHVLFLFVLYSTIFVGPTIIDFRWDEAGRYYITKRAYSGFCVMLIALQIIQCIWFGMICRVAWRVVTGKGAADERSDDEDKNNDKKDD